MARSFTGSNTDYVDVGAVSAIYSPTLPAFVGAWTYQTANFGSQAIIGDSSASGWTVKTQQFNATHNIGLTNNGIADYDSTIAYPLNKWVYVAVHWTDTTALFYLWDGATLTTSSVGITTQNAGTRTRIGGGYNNAAEAFNGRIASAIVITGFSSSQQNNIVKHLASGVAPPKFFGTIQGYWPLWGASPEPDLSGNQRNGTLNGSPTIANHAPVVPYVPVVVGVTSATSPPPPPTTLPIFVQC